MSKGLMWQPETELIEEILLAAQHFLLKYGEQPTTCRMRASQIPPFMPYSDSAKEQRARTVAGIRIIPDETITPGHFLLCYEEVENG